MPATSEENHIEEIQSLRKVIQEQSQRLQEQSQKIKLLEEEIARLKNKPKKAPTQAEQGGYHGKAVG